MKQIIIFFTLVFFYANVFAQTAVNLQINHTFPVFTFNDVRFYKKTIVSLTDFRGQWLILDCWNRYCSVCLERMQHTDSLSRQFKSVNFFMVGYTGSRYTHKSDNQPIHKLYPELRQRFKLTVPIAYDSVLFHHFAVGECPYIIIIDPKGLVKGITTELTKGELENIIAGKTVYLEKAVNRNGK